MTFRTPGIRRRLGGGRSRLLLPTLVTLAVLVIAFMVVTSVWTDLLWYRSVGLSRVYTTQLWARTSLFFGGGLLMALLVAVNMAVAHRLRPAYRPLSVEQQGLERYRAIIDPRRRAVTSMALLLLGVLTGASVAGQWPVWLAFLNRTSFGVRDPQFHKDISFYVFTYPFLRLVLGVVFATVILSMLAAVMVHYLYGGLRMQGPGDKVSPAARAHLSVLIGLFVLLKAFAYWFDRYGLVHSERGVRTGASYTDVNALLPAKTILAVIAIVCALLFFSNLLRRGMALPGVGLVLLVLSALLIGGLYPLLIQRFQVKPDEQNKERRFIQRNIDATRAAYGVDGITLEPYGGRPETDQGRLAAAARDLSGVRLLDPVVVSPTYQQLQQIREFYRFPDTLDVDRYQVNGRPEDSVVAVRELSGPPKGQNSWVKDRLIYTHGYGFVRAPGERLTADGTPDFQQKDIPQKDVTGPPVGTPQIYFGERTTDYSVVGGQGQKEFDHPDPSDSSQQVNTTYQGRGGVPVDSALNRTLFAAEFQDWNLLLSGAIKKDARILYHRTPREIVHRAAPWLTLDGNPYPVAVGGRIQWVLDGYTTSNGYPYAQTLGLQDATRDTITDTRSAVAKQADHQVNYLRNSVKATVDAYDGTVHLYLWDAQDPIARTWTKVFPGTVEPKSKIPPELLDHLRYPEDLFKVQRRILAQYHVTQADAFYGGQGFWDVPEDPSPANKGKTQPPYYLSLRMPQQPGVQPRTSQPTAPEAGPQRPGGRPGTTTAMTPLPPSPTPSPTQPNPPTGTPGPGQPPQGAGQPVQGGGQANPPGGQQNMRGGKQPDGAGTQFGAPRFSLTSVYTPRGQRNLSAFLTADSTPGDPGYGRLRLLEMPTADQPGQPRPQGPGQVQQAFENDHGIRNLLFPTRGSGTETKLGNLLSLPFAGGLLYVEPLYSQTTQSNQAPYPTLLAVLVKYGDRVAFASRSDTPQPTTDLFQSAMSSLFASGTGQSPGVQPGLPGNARLSPEAQKAISDLSKAIDDYKTAMSKNDYAALGDAWNRILQARSALTAATRKPAT
ncbi:UPF0182 family membrane protein [Actinomadura harenae]|uniref:UPF0182 protein EBO15_26790 n=1 Tax=Actinomadura harenae TaxID=2483351 RepID=A0A3M2LSH3_9ACTN|nr:UPF0182 family protein [Actinomadura harenae]RMI40347.1 UPF0182 family protein [Actinomadura harenae]